jgi:asparagine synthase (glutamine-hydrolysing)
MCGVIAIHSAGAPLDEAALNSALASLSHRGPDGSGRWISEDRRIALGHRRLAVVGGNNGTQPVENEDGSIILVANGEVYGYRELRRELEARGHRFRTASDSEVILHLYEEHGLDLLERLRGEFAFILWDSREQRIFAARDRFGIKPLNYAFQGGTMMMASEAKALLALGHPRSWDEESFFHSISMQYLPLDRTHFEGIRQLPPGHFLVYRNGTLRVQEYWDLIYPREDGSVPTPVTPAEKERLVEEFAALLDDSITIRLDADEAPAFHLSGGVDSSAVVGFAARHLTAPPICFTVSFDEQSYDELPMAREVARFHDARLLTVPVSQNDLVQALGDAVYFSEGFAINGHLPAKFILSRAIRDAGHRFVLTGEGSDEVLAGYPHLRQDLLQMANGAGAALEALAASNQASAGLMLAEGDHGLSLDSVRARIGYVPNFLMPKAALGRNLRNLLHDEFLAAHSDTDCYARFLDALPLSSAVTGRHPVHQSLYLWCKCALANYILRTLGDGTEMAHGIEGRLPFLDHRLFEFLRALPFDMKINGLVEKYILREAARPVLPDSIYRRPKHPFVAPPLGRYASAELLGQLEDFVSGSPHSELQFWDRKKVLEMLKRLPTLPDRERAAQDPALMMVLSSIHMKQKFEL